MGLFRRGLSLSLGRTSTLCLAALVGLLWSPHLAAATDGIWKVTASGNWSTASNWTSIADGIGATANFGFLGLLDNTTAHLDSSRTLGSAIFADDLATFNWTVDNAGVSANTLTMAVTTGSPSIVVVNDAATISAVIAGSQGLTATGGKDGSFTGTGTVILANAANTYSGGTTIGTSTFSGILDISADGDLGASGAGQRHYLCQQWNVGIRLQLRAICQP